jgi:hypothetical protein
MGIPVKHRCFLELAGTDDAMMVVCVVRWGYYRTVLQEGID